MSEDGDEQAGEASTADANGARLSAILQPLLPSLERLSLISRHLHPATIEAVVNSRGAAGDMLHEARTAPSPWPENLAPLGAQLDRSADQVLAAFDELAQAPGAEQPVFQAYKALRRLPRALEALYPVAGFLAPVSRFFLEPESRNDEALVQSLSGVAPDGTGVQAYGPDLDSRETVWTYVPENHDPRQPCPLIVALHGGAGRGRGFLWSWLRTARSHGAIVLAPTSLGSTWALQGDDIDTPHLKRVVEFAQGRWSIDPARMLLTGMSDGGTFSYVSGLLADSPFTHLAPFSAAFHPMLGAFADADRVRGLPVHIVHGTQDWMFPADMARQAHEWLKGAGARVTYREIEDLSHTYAADLNSSIIEWMNASAAG
ncbi:phospholipase [Minwuia sp.]|uniref:carboxylesterase family protein n=1 Tax=Minwuia sp. TaxID=2493630 RepID=UPI003A93ADBB